MLRGSDKHGARIDEAMVHDTRSLLQGAPVEARSQESREQEGPGDGEPVPDALLTGDRGVVDADMLGHDEVEARSTLAAWLPRTVWPADREALIGAAQERNAPAEVVDRLRELPDGVFSHTEAVWEALGGGVELRR